MAEKNPQKLEVLFAKNDQSGKEPVRDWLKNLSKNEKKKKDYRRRHCGGSIWLAYRYAPSAKFRKWIVGSENQFGKSHCQSHFLYS